MTEQPVEEAIARPWFGVLAPEAIRSGDGRKFSSGSLRARSLPLPLTWQKVSAPGHDQNVTVAKIERLMRVTTPEGVEVRGAGHYLATSEADEAHSLVGEFERYGVSIDADDIDQSSIQMDEDGSTTYTDARVCSACIVSIPAFAEAWVSNGEAPEDFFPEGSEELLGRMDEVAAAVDEALAEVELDPLTASGGWGVPSEWFEKPEDLAKGMGIKVTPEGRVYGYIAEWGVCHITYTDECVVAPHSNTDYAYFRTGVIDTAEGTEVEVGTLTYKTGHARHNLRARPAAAHYDNTGTAWAYVATGEDENGIWYSGMVKPGTSADDLNEIRAAGRLSGDWRGIKDELELVAALTVNVAGFPLEKALAASSNGRQISLVAAGVVSAANGPKSSATVKVSVDEAKLAAAVVDEMEARAKRREIVAELRGRYADAE